MKARDDSDGLASALGLVQDQIKEIKSRDPENAEGLALEATLWVNDGETDKAAAQLEKVIARQPELQSAALLLAGIYENEDRIVELEKELAKLKSCK